VSDGTAIFDSADLRLRKKSQKKIELKRREKKIILVQSWDFSPAHPNIVRQLITFCVCVISSRKDELNKRGK
jgi:hypothetical protein